MQFIKLKGIQANRYRKNGTKEVTPLFVKKSHKFGKLQEETAISRKKNILITGEHDSGKSKFLIKLHSSALDIWGGHNRAHGTLYFDYFQPISEWYDSPELIEWYSTQSKRDWRKLKGYEKAKLLPQYCKDKKVALFLDNADRLTGRKLDLAKKCILSARVTIATMQAENRLSPSIRKILLSSDPQFLRLSSENAYDATDVFILGLIATCIMAGLWEAAFILGGMRMFGRGRSASKGV